MAVESGRVNAPSRSAGILPKGLASMNSGVGATPGPNTRFSTSIPFSAATTSTLRTKGDRLEP